MTFSGETSQGLKLIRRPTVVSLTLQSYLDRRVCRRAPAYSPGDLCTMIAECVHQQHANCSAWSPIGAFDWKQLHSKILLLPTKHDPAMNVSWGVNLMQQNVSDWLSVFDGLLHVMSDGAGSSCKLSFASCAAAAC